MLLESFQSISFKYKDQTKYHISNAGCPLNFAFPILNFEILDYWQNSTIAIQKMNTLNCDTFLNPLEGQQSTMTPTSS